MPEEYEHLGESFEDKCLSGFYKSLGVRAFTAAGFCWRSAGLRFFTPVPLVGPISLSPQDLRSMWNQGALFVHLPSEETKHSFPGYIFVVEDKNYDFGNIDSGNRRHNIRRAFKHCTVESIPFELLHEKAALLIQDTYYRQGRNYNSSVLEGWQNYFKAASSNPLFEAWGAFVSGELAAFKVEFTYHGAVQADMVFSRGDLLKYYPVNALLFVSTQIAIRRDNISSVSYGMCPVTGEPESLVNFKESMGFKKVLLRERLEINPLVQPAFQHPLSFVIKAIADRYYNRSEYARIVSGIISTLRGHTSHAGTGET
jgi:hypothetical protein